MMLGDVKLNLNLGELSLKSATVLGSNNNGKYSNSVRIQYPKYHSGHCLVLTGSARCLSS